MQFECFEGDLLSLQTDLIAFGTYTDSAWVESPGLNTLNAALEGLLKTVADEEGFEGKDGQNVKLHTHGRVGPKRIVLFGLGSSGNMDARTLAARAARIARSTGLAHVTVVNPNGAEDAGTAMVEGALLGHYSFDRWKTENVKESKLKKVQLVDASVSNADIQNTMRRVDGVTLGRDLVNEPPVVATPSYLVDQARQIAKENNLECNILGRKELEAKKMKLLLAVSAGSCEEPFLIHLTYRPEGTDENTPSVAVVGKGLTFDAGGLCLKPPGSMGDMKLDMAGGAAVLGMMKAIDAVKPNVVVHAMVPTSENLLGEAAYKPGDVITGYAGKTVEIVNTDAEGRLILADALAYAVEQGVDEIIDLATLTGAICVALGNESAGVFGNNEQLRDEVVVSAEQAGESVWPMPLDKRLKKKLKSSIADMTNCGERWGGAITAALFLSEFVGDVDWVHMDIAGPSFAAKDRDLTRKGGTGFAITTLLSYLERAGDRLK